MKQQNSRDWVRLVPFVTWILNSQYNPQTGFSPSDLFFGRPTWTPELIPEPESTPIVESWVLEQKELCDIAGQRLRKLREKRMSPANKGRKEAKYQIGDFVLVHKKRFPQWTLSKLSTQWFGPYRIIKIQHASVTIRASPTLGGEVQVG